MTSEAASPQPTISHGVAAAREGTVHYRRAGTGADTVVLLHGFPQTGRSWNKVAVRLANRFTVIAPDLRGAGETFRPAAGYDKKTIAADIHDLVGSLGSRRIHLVGHDIGGMVAYAYAVQWPDEVVSLTMIDMLLPGFGIEALYALRQPGRFAHMPFFMTQDLPEWLVVGREEAFFDWFIRNALVDQGAFGPEDIAAYARTYARPGGGCALASTGSAPFGRMPRTTRCSRRPSWRCRCWRSAARRAWAACSGSRWPRSRTMCARS